MRNRDGSSEESLHSNAFVNKITHSARPLKTPHNDSQEQRKPSRRQMSQMMKDQQNSHFSDHSIIASKSLKNSSINKKVPFHINQNSVRKQCLSDLNISLNIVFLTGNSVTGIDSDAQILFDLSKEAYMLGSCLLTFDLNDNFGSEQIYLEFCGDRIFELHINGISIPIDSVSWKNNQISLTSLRGGIFISLRQKHCFVEVWSKDFRNSSKGFRFILSNT